MHAYHESLKDVPTVLTEFCKHELGPTGRERMRVGRLGDGDVLYRPSEGHLVRFSAPPGIPFLVALVERGQPISDATKCPPQNAAAK